MLSQSSLSDAPTFDVVDAPEHTIQTQSGAPRTLIIGIVVGILGTFLTYNRLPALGFAIFALIGIAGLYLNARSQHARPLRRNLFLVALMVFFAAMLAIRSGEQIVLLNIAGIGLAALLLAYFFTTGNFAAQDVLQYVNRTLSAALMVILKPIDELALSWNWFRARRIQWAMLKPVIRGLIITIPVVAVFVLLLSSADKVFSDFVSGIFGAISFANFDQLIVPTVLTALLAWAGIGWMGYALADRKAKRMPRPGSLEASMQAELPPVFPELPLAERKQLLQPKNFQLGFTETVMLLGSICAVFGAFVVIQFVYLFGGAKNIDLTKFNYADYVHRGFTELIIVGVLTLGLAYILKNIAVRSSAGRESTFRILLTVLMALSGVILVSAYDRMHLYEDVYGATTLRLTIYVFIAWLGVLFVGFVLSLYWQPAAINVFGLATLVAVFGFAATLDVLNPDAFVANEMIARNDVDPLYLATLNTEAIPAMVQLVDAPEPGLRDIVRYTLARQRNALAADTWNADWRDFSIGRSAALAALDSVKDKIPESVSSVMPDAVHVKSDFDFLKPGMTFRQIVRQLGNPDQLYFLPGYDNNVLAVHYRVGDAPPPCSHWIEVDIDTQNGFKDVLDGCGKSLMSSQN